LLNTALILAQGVSRAKCACTAPRIPAFRQKFTAFYTFYNHRFLFYR
jgi:hypothetical protein